MCDAVMTTPNCLFCSSQIDQEHASAQGSCCSFDSCNFDSELCSTLPGVRYAIFLFNQMVDWRFCCLICYRKNRSCSWKCPPKNDCTLHNVCVTALYQLDEIRWVCCRANRNKSLGQSANPIMSAQLLAFLVAASRGDTQASASVVKFTKLQPERLLA